MKAMLSPMFQRIHNEGVCSSLVQAIMAILNARFGDAPEEVEIQLRQINNLKTLHTLVVQASTASSVGEFEEELRNALETPSRKKR